MDGAPVQHAVSPRHHSRPGSRQDPYDDIDGNTGYEESDSMCVTQSSLRAPSTDLPIVPLAVIILGRDVLLSLSAFYIRYASLPAPVRRGSCAACIR